MQADIRDRTAEYFRTLESVRQTLLQAEKEAGKHAANAAADAVAVRPVSGGGGRKTAVMTASLSSAESAPLLSMLSAADIVPAQSEFTSAASQISKGITQVAEKLEKLTHLARQRSNFDDPVEEINKLTYVIKTDLQSLDLDIDALQKMGRANKGPGGGSAPTGKQSAAATNAIVDSLKFKLAGTTKEFADVLQIRTQNLKEQHNRRTKFEQKSKSNPPAFRKRTANPFDRVLQQNGGGATPIPSDEKGGSKDAIDGEINTDHHRSPPSTGGLVDDQMQVAVVEQDAYLQSRVEAVQTIETTLVELATLYKRLIEIIGAQDEQIIRISDDVEAARENVESGQNQLVLYIDKLVAGRWLMIKVFTVIIAFAFFFILFIK
jgi:syntaxin 5